MRRCPCKGTSRPSSQAMFPMRNCLCEAEHAPHWARAPIYTGVVWAWASETAAGGVAETIDCDSGRERCVSSVRWPVMAWGRGGYITLGGRALGGLEVVWDLLSDAVTRSFPSNRSLPDFLSTSCCNSTSLQLSHVQLAHSSIARIYNQLCYRVPRAFIFRSSWYA